MGQIELHDRVRDRHRIRVELVPLDHGRARALGLQIVIASFLIKNIRFIANKKQGFLQPCFSIQ